MAFKFTVDHTDLKIETNLVGLKQDLTFVNLTAANVFLDADSKDLFFTSGHPNAIIISLTDTPVVSFSKAASDTTSVSEESVLTVGKGLSDTLTISESLDKFITFGREFTDTSTVSESATLAFSTSQADSATVSESSVLSFSSAQADSATVSESPALSFSTAQAETATISDAPALGFETGQSDSSTLSESEVKAVGKVVDDSITSDRTFVVTVASGTNSYGAGNKYFIDGVLSPGLILNSGFTYTFDQSDSSNSGHPLRFSTTANGTHNSGSEYTINITTNGIPGTSGAYTKIIVSDSTPDLHYYCSVHSGMGAETSMQDVGDTTFAVTVASGVNNYGSGNKYYIDGVVSPLIHLVSGNTYTFDTSDFSNSGHPFRFSETANGSHNSGSQYTTGVTTNGSAGYSGAYTRIQITNSTTETLHYYCTNHSGMGGEVNLSLTVGDFSVTEALVFSYATVLADAYTLDDTASASDDLRTDINIVKGNVLTVDDGTDGVDGTQVVLTTEPFSSDTSSISESAALAFTTAFADSVTMSDTPFVNPGQVVTDAPNLSEAIQSLTFAKSLSDSATISESLSITFVSGASSVLNTAALNTSVLN